MCYYYSYPNEKRVLLHGSLRGPYVQFPKVINREQIDLLENLITPQAHN